MCSVVHFAEFVVSLLALIITGQAEIFTLSTLITNSRVIDKFNIDK